MNRNSNTLFSARNTLSYLKGAFIGLAFCLAVGPSLKKAEDRLIDSAFDDFYLDKAREDHLKDQFQDAKSELEMVTNHERPAYIGLQKEINRALNP